jgi:hypothetical protein
LLRRGQGDFDLHFVDLRAADQGPEANARDLEIDDRAVADIGSTPPQAIFEMAALFRTVRLVKNSK